MSWNVLKLAAPFMCSSSKLLICFGTFAFSSHTEDSQIMILESWCFLRSVDFFVVRGWGPFTKSRVCSFCIYLYSHV